VQEIDHGLPPGLAIVTFATTALDKLQVKYIAPPRKATLEPYRGHHTAVMTETGSELIELVEV
jgi:hypothetical protein